MKPQTYFGHLESIRTDTLAIEAEKRRLDDLIIETAKQIRLAITPKRAVAVIWALAAEEMARVNSMISNPTDHRISDFAGHSRHLRAIAASVPFNSWEAQSAPKLDDLFKLCESHWVWIGHRQMLDTLAESTGPSYARHHSAASMSLLSAFQCEQSYTEQACSRVRRLYLNFSQSVVEPQLGVSVENICHGFSAVGDLIGDRVDAARELMRPLHSKHSEYSELAKTDISDEELNAFVFDDPRHDEIAEKFIEGQDILAKLIVFTPEDLTPTIGEASADFLKSFSYVPRTINASYATPFDNDEVRARPFATMADGSYLLTEVHYAAFAPLYRLPELFSSGKQKQKLTKRRDDSLEEDAFGLLSKVIDPDKAYLNYYVDVAADGSAAERDVLLISGNIALVAECKARPLRNVGSHRGSIQKIDSDIRRTIQEGYDQACSVIAALREADRDLTIWDSEKPLTRSALHTFIHGDIEECFPVVVLDTYYGFLATDLAPWLKVDQAIGYPWVIDRDSLETILGLVCDLEQLRDFLRWRIRIHGKLRSEDEAVFAGFFLRHVDIDPPENADMGMLDASYADIFDIEYYRKKGVLVEHDELPGQGKPPVWVSMERRGDELFYSVGGEARDSFNLMTGESSSPATRVDPPIVSKEIYFPKKIGRNAPCPCGSSKKYKKCCLPRYSQHR